MGEYPDAGVNYAKIEPFKMAMIEAGKRTLNFPNRRGVFINQDALHSHGGIYEFRPGKWWEIHKWIYAAFRPPRFCNTLEGLGNKNWIAECMYQMTGLTAYLRNPPYCTIMMAANDVTAQGALPVVYEDEVAAGDSDWFNDPARAKEMAEGYYEGCKEAGMALVAGESPALRYLIKAEPPVKSAPSLSGCVTGIIFPRNRLITGKEFGVGDVIVGAASTGMHANGASLIIKRGLTLPEQFLTKLPNGKTLGEEALIPTRSYVALVEALLEDGVKINAFLPGTGGGVAKIAFDKRPMTYRIHNWPKDIPQIFTFMRELGVSLEDCLTTFNWGIGYYCFVAKKEVAHTIKVGEKAGYSMYELGRVEEGERKVIFEPENITLPPPGE